MFTCIRNNNQTYLLPRRLPLRRSVWCGECLPAARGQAGFRVERGVLWYIVVSATRRSSDLCVWRMDARVLFGAAEYFLHTYTETKKQSPNTGARANNTLLYTSNQYTTEGSLHVGILNYIAQHISPRVNSNRILLMYYRCIIVYYVLCIIVYYRLILSSYITSIIIHYYYYNT